MEPLTPAQQVVMDRAAALTMNMLTGMQELLLRAERLFLAAPSSDATNQWLIDLARTKHHDREAQKNLLRELEAHGMGDMLDAAQRLGPQG